VRYSQQNAATWSRHPTMESRHMNTQTDRFADRPDPRHEVQQRRRAAMIDRLQPLAGLIFKPSPYQSSNEAGEERS
jgi:hypothetical protein